MSLLPTPYLYSELSLACPHCGQKEDVPADASAQQRQLRLRLIQIQQAREAAEAPLNVMATIRQHWLVALIPLALISVTQVSQVVSTPVLPLQSAAVILVMASIGVGMIGGYFGMMRCYRKLVQPLLCARPPRQLGLSARCRTCGGDLPPIRDFEVTCGFCFSKNLLGKSLAGDVSQILANEVQEYQARAMKNWDNGVYAKPMQAFYVWGTGVALVFSVVGIVVLCLIRA